MHRCLLEKLLKEAEGFPELEQYAQLFLLSYAFLLRVPSEAIPVQAWAGRCSLEVTDDRLTLRLHRRKNKPEGSVLTRTCWCRESPATCPLHKLGPVVRALRSGAFVFPDVTSDKARRALKYLLIRVGVEDAGEYRLHDLRRGHGKDLQMSGETNQKILHVLEQLHGCRRSTL